VFYFRNPYPYAYNQQPVYQQQYPVLFQPPVEVVQLSDSDEDVHKVSREADPAPCTKDSAPSTKDTPIEIIADEPISTKASETTMIEELKKLGYNVVKPNEASVAPTESFVVSDIKITDVTSIKVPSPINFTNNDDPLDTIDESHSDHMPLHYSPPESPISPTDLPSHSDKLPILAITAPKSRPPPPAPPSNLYSFMQHANTPARARRPPPAYRHMPPTPSPQKNRSVSFTDHTSPSKPLNLEEPVPTYTSPLENIYEPAKHKISVDEYKQRRVLYGNYSSQNGAPRPRPPVDLMKQYYSEHVDTQQKPSNGLVHAQNKATNGYVHPQNVKTSKPVKLKAPLKSILKKPEEQEMPGKKTHKSSSSPQKKLSQESAPFVSPKKSHVPDIFPVGSKTPLKVQTKSPVVVLKRSRDEIIVRHNKEYYYEVNNEDKTRCTICKGSYKYITKHFKEKHSDYEVSLFFICKKIHEKFQ
jgi:hypothetical protein